MARLKEYKIFSTPNCGYCYMLKDLLTEKKIPFTDINVAADPSKGMEMIKKTGQMGVPVSVIVFDDGKEEVILGFDQERIVKILGLEK